jgi:hypothetical protein
MKSLPGKRAVIGLLAIVAVMMLPLAAQADTVTTLDAAVLWLIEGNVSDTSGLSVYMPTYFGKVNVLLEDVLRADNTEFHRATFTFTALNNFVFVDAKTLGVNLSGSFTPELTSISTSGGGAPILNLVVNNTGEQTLDGFGVFNVVYAGSNGMSAAGQFTSATFAVDGPLSWTNIWDNVFASTSNTPQQYLAAAHMGLPVIGGLTGFAANGPYTTVPPPPVPVPPTVWLMGSGLIGIGLLGWRRKKS